MFLRIAFAPVQYVTDISFVEQGVNHRGRKATEASTSAWVDLWRDAWREIDAWRGLGATPSPCEDPRLTPLLRRCSLALSLLMTRLVMTWLMLLASWWLRSTARREASERRGTRPSWPSHAWLTGLLSLVLRGSDGTLTRLGFLGVGG